jgi:molybdopterin synthase catalytic subunit
VPRLIEIGSEPLVLERAIAAVRSDADGAVVAFLGVVRELSDEGRSVRGLSYEAYPAMALAQLNEIADEAERRFAPCRVACLHRIGALVLGEASVAVAVAAPHRAAAFDACEYVIDELKARVSIWKRELYRDGASEWRANAGASEP